MSDTELLTRDANVIRNAIEILQELTDQAKKLSPDWGDPEYMLGRIRNIQIRAEGVAEKLFGQESYHMKHFAINWNSKPMWILIPDERDKWWRIDIDELVDNLTSMLDDLRLTSTT